MFDTSFKLINFRDRNNILTNSAANIRHRPITRSQNGESDTCAAVVGDVPMAPAVLAVETVIPHDLVEHGHSLSEFGIRLCLGGK